MKSLNSLVDLFYAVVKQRRALFYWEDDVRFVSEKGTILYVADTNVIKFYTEHPEENKQYQPDYGIFSRKDYKGTEAIISRRIAEHIFFNLSKNKKLPIIILPPMGDEIHRLYDAILEASYLEQESVDSEICSESVKQLLKELQDQKDVKIIFDKLTKESELLGNFLAGNKGPSAEIRRFSTLHRHKRIVKVKDAISMIGDETLSDALDILNKREGKDIEKTLKNDWYNRLMEVSGSAKPQINNRIDAQVLARIQLINNQLNTNRKKLIFLTKDNTILKAGEKYKPPGSTESFSRLYLRHPGNYIAEPDVLMLKSDEKGNRTFIDWLDTFINKVDMGESEYRSFLDELLSEDTERSRIENLVKPILQSNPDIAAECYDRWQDYTKNLSLNSWNEVCVDLDRESRILLDQTKDILARVQDLRRGRERETLNSIFEIAIETGLTQQNTTKPRLAPILTFESFPVARKFLSDMLISGETERKTEEQIRELQEEDNSYYTYYLISATQFATNGNWRVSEILARKALDVVAVSNSQDNITGREALYLRAVALRHTARNNADLVAIPGLLDKAEELLERERRLRPGLLAGEVRFKAERLSLDLTYHQYKLYLNEEFPDTAIYKVRDIESLETSIMELLDELHNTLSSEKNENELWIAKDIQRRQLKNYFSLLELRAITEGSVNNVEITRTMREYFKFFEENLRNDRQPEIEIDYLVDVIYLFASWFLSDNENIRKKNKEKLMQRLATDEIRKFLVSPFDKNRYERLLKWINC